MTFRWPSPENGEDVITSLIFSVSSASVSGVLGPRFPVGGESPEGVACRAYTVERGA